MHKVDVPSYEAKHKYTGAVLPALDTTYYFDQLIDHNNASLGTFKQRYWFSYSYYEPGEWHSFTLILSAEPKMLIVP